MCQSALILYGARRLKERNLQFGSTSLQQALLKRSTICVRYDLHDKRVHVDIDKERTIFLNAFPACLMILSESLFHWVIEMLPFNLQRVANEYQLRSRRPTDDSMASEVQAKSRQSTVTGGNISDFASANNLGSSIAYLSSSLAG